MDINAIFLIHEAFSRHSKLNLATEAKSTRKVTSTQ